MSKQEAAQKRWADQQKLDKIKRLLAVATDYSYPAGQAQIGIQLATVEIPWLLQHIEELKESNGAEEPVLPALGLIAQSG